MEVWRVSVQTLKAFDANSTDSGGGGGDGDGDADDGGEDVRDEACNLVMASERSFVRYTGWEVVVEGKDC